jgi:hypothetical protein
VAASQIDGSTADNILVGSGAGIPSEVRVYRSDLPSQSGKAPSLFSTFSPYPDDRSGASVASGFVDFATGRYSIVTAPGPGSPAQVKVFVYPLTTPIGAKTKSAGKTADMCPDDPGKPNLAAAFMPFGLDYKGGLSLATGWLAGPLGGAERIVVGQLAAPGAVKVFSSGSLLQGGPAMYLAPAEHSPIVGFTELHAVRGKVGRDRGDDEHDHGRGSAGERRLVEGQHRAGSQIRAGQALAASDQHGGQTTRHRRLGGGLAAECAWRRLRS